MSSTSVPAELLDPIVAYFGPLRVILFGSAARGNANQDSDFDLLVITLRAGFEASRAYRRAADVIPVRASTFATRAAITGTLSEAAFREGIVVYERT
jgi:predicted nucleotidyltransferase